MSKLSLPDKFDRRVTPTMKSAWYRMWDWRPAGWWWHVAYCIRVKRVAHKNEKKIKALCALVDKHLPHLRDRYVRPEPHTDASLPSRERWESGRVRGLQNLEGYD